MGKRRRRIPSIRAELISKSREAALAAVQIFNNPNITFKAEAYVILMIVSWTYLLHAYYRTQKIDYRYFAQRGKKRIFDKTKKGAYKHWELERCLNDQQSPIDKDTSNNLRFMIGLRHEIEHQMTTRIDDLLSARFQACCLNYNRYIVKLFGKDNSIDKHLSFSLQFSSISRGQKDMLDEHPELPSNIHSYIQEFDNTLTDEEYGSERYAYRILFVPKTANRKGQADKVIEFVKADSDLARQLNTEYAVIKETERPKFLPKQIVKMMNRSGFPKFNMHHHTQLWKQEDARNPSKGYGCLVASKYWHYYKSWVDFVEKHCNENKDKYA